MYEILKKRNQGLRDDVVKFAQQLIQQPSPSLNEGPLSSLVYKKMVDLGYDQVYRDEFGNIIGLMLGREAGPTLLLNSHMDTMPTGDIKQWQKSPFSGDTADNKLYGCGASDCKAGLAAQIFAGALLKRSLLPLKGNLVVAASVGQECGGNIGICGLIEKTLPQMELSPSYAVLGEPTELAIYYGHDGWIELEIKVEGQNRLNTKKAAKAIVCEFNSSQQYQSINDTDNFIVQKTNLESNNSSGPITIGLNQRINYLEDVDAVVRRLKHDAALVTRIMDDVAVDVTICQEVQKTYTGKATIVKKITHAWSIDPFNPLIDSARHSLFAAGSDVQTGKWQLGKVGMGTAGGLLLKNYGIPAIGYGPGNEATAHGPNEYVETEKIIEAVYGTAVMAQSMIGIPVFGWTSAEV